MEQIIATILGLIDSTYIIAEGQVGEDCIRAKVANQAGAYPGFLSMKRLRIFLLPPGWDASPSQGYAQH